MSIPSLSNRRWLAVIIVAAGILVASVIRPPGGQSAGPRLVVGLDKYLHAIGFAALAGTLALSVSRADQLLAVVAVAVGYGLLIELLQLPLPYRSFSLLDVAADAVGVLVVALAWRIRQYLRQRGDPRPE